MNSKKNISSKTRKVKEVSWHLEIYARSVKVNNHFKFQSIGGGMRSEIKSFTNASRKRLKFKAGNAFPELISQFCMSYHKTFPQGREVKKHLNLFLTRLRKKWKCGYLWILEFQTRGVPHFHMFLTLDRDTPNLKEWLAKTWNDIVEKGNKEHLTVHMHDKNFIQWSMYNPGYLCKYLSKQAQKVVPDNFDGVGRFWGSSRGLVPRATVITPQMIDENYPEKPSKKIKRAIYKHHEHQCRKYKKTTRAKDKMGRCLIPAGGIVFEKLVEYYDKRLEEVIPF